MKLLQDFFAQDTVRVAERLIGTTLIFNGALGTRRGLIVETEAYKGPEDLASHASRGRTKRTEPMFGSPGFTYIYLVYGMHWCLNIVTEHEDYPAAVLVRALAPLEPKDSNKMASGPGKTTRWLGITGEQNQLDATGEILYIEDTQNMDLSNVIASERIGIPYALEWQKKLWRFTLKDHPAVSLGRKSK